jgi:7,8-dihydroneopterin aldolase/epimerase/oxygenase
MSTIRFEGMEFFAFHGHFKEEQIIGTKFNVDLDFDYESQNAEVSDQLADAVNYQDIFSLVKQEMAKNSHLLEHVARRILDTLNQHFPLITRARVKISKMNPQLGGKVEQVSCILSY